MSALQGAFVANSQVRLWLSQVMIKRHSADSNTMHVVELSVGSEQAMTKFIAECRSALVSCGFQSFLTKIPYGHPQSFCSVTDQMVHVNGIVPGLQSELATLRQITEASKTQLVEMGREQQQSEKRFDY